MRWLALVVLIMATNAYAADCSPQNSSSWSEGERLIEQGRSLMDQALASFGRGETGWHLIHEQGSALAQRGRDLKAQALAEAERCRQRQRQADKSFRDNAFKRLSQMPREALVNKVKEGLPEAAAKGYDAFEFGKSQRDLLRGGSDISTKVAESTLQLRALPPAPSGSAWPLSGHLLEVSQNVYQNTVQQTIEQFRGSMRSLDQAVTAQQSSLLTSVERHTGLEQKGNSLRMSDADMSRFQAKLAPAKPPPVVRAPAPPRQPVQPQVRARERRRESAPRARPSEPQGGVCPAGWTVKSDLAGEPYCTCGPKGPPFSDIGVYPGPASMAGECP
jgi:hypothetical protein